MFAKMNKINSCPFCNFELLEATFVHEYNHWNLFLQSADRRRKTKGAAGFLATKKHVETPEITTDEVWLEVKDIIRDASERLCRSAGMTYRGGETVGLIRG